MGTGAKEANYGTGEIVLRLKHPNWVSHCEDSTAGEADQSPVSGYSHFPDKLPSLLWCSD